VVNRSNTFRFVILSEAKDLCIADSGAMHRSFGGWKLPQDDNE
jgi:hypothetical protein